MDRIGRAAAEIAWAILVTFGCLGAPPLLVGGPANFAATIADVLSSAGVLPWLAGLAAAAWSRRRAGVWAPVLTLALGAALAYVLASGWSVDTFAGVAIIAAVAALPIEAFRRIIDRRSDGARRDDDRNR